MQEYQRRITDELKVLNVKRDALRKFIMDQKGGFNDLSAEEKSLLISQQQIMGQYAEILGRRIKAFE